MRAYTALFLKPIYMMTPDLLSSCKYKAAAAGSPQKM